MCSNLGANAQHRLESAPVRIHSKAHIVLSGNTSGSTSQRNAHVLNAEISALVDSDVTRSPLKQMESLSLTSAFFGSAPLLKRRTCSTGHGPRLSRKKDKPCLQKAKENQTRGPRQPRWKAPVTQPPNPQRAISSPKEKLTVISPLYKHYLKAHFNHNILTQHLVFCTSE